MDADKEMSAKNYQAAQENFALSANISGNLDGKSQMSRTQPSAMFRGAQAKSMVGGLSQLDHKQITD